MSRSAIVALVMGLGLAGCASQQTGDVYTRDEARQPATVQSGAIVALRPVTIEGTKSPVGAAAGSIAGGVAASAIGGGRGSAISAVIGAVAGGLLGGAAEEGLTRAQGVELIIRLDNGSERAYVQALQENERFVVGERVRIISTGSNSRVQHAN
ncbi:MAG: hypothetical protein VW625_06775 [Perlucidibaca sp.]